MDILEITYNFHKATKNYYVYTPEGDLTCSSLYIHISVYRRPPAKLISRVQEVAVL